MEILLLEYFDDRAVRTETLTRTKDVVEIRDRVRKILFFPIFFTSSVFAAFDEAYGEVSRVLPSSPNLVDEPAYKSLHFFCFQNSMTAWVPTTFRSCTISGSNTLCSTRAYSPRWNMTSGVSGTSEATSFVWPVRYSTPGARFNSEPVKWLSSEMTCAPLCASRAQRRDPTKPAPPVTRMSFCAIVASVHSFCIVFNNVPFAFFEIACCGECRGCRKSERANADPPQIVRERYIVNGSGLQNGRSCDLFA